MQSFFFNVVGVSITVSIVVIILFLLAAFLKDRYLAKWSYFIWLVLAIRLLIPIDFGITSPPVELKLADREIAYTIHGSEGPSHVSSSNHIEAVLTDRDPSLNGVQMTNQKSTVDDDGASERKQDERTVTISRIVSWIYIFGVLLFLFCQLCLYASFRFSARRWYREADARITGVFESLKKDMGINKPLQIRICRKISSPMIVGLIKSTLLLPHEEYESSDLEVILKHELIHYRRNDLWYKFILISANALHWFNPVIYLMVSEANKDIEIACDEEVLQGTDQQVRKRYSERILDMMRRGHCPSVPASTSFHGGKGMMKARIRHIFDERTKKKGVLPFLAVTALVLAFSACRFGIGQAYWEIPISKATYNLSGLNTKDIGNSEMNDFTVKLPFDMNQNGKEDTVFSLDVAEEGKICTLKYNNADGRTKKIKVFENIEQGFSYGIQAANLEDWNSVRIIVSVDYRGMPFGSGYWELYVWKNDRFERIDLKPVEENLEMRILSAEEARNNVMKADGTTYLYDKSQYPAESPVASLFFKDEFKGDGTLRWIVYAPMSEYDTEGFRNWGQDAAGKVMTGMNFVSGSSVKGWDPSATLLETEEIVYITLPNITATVHRYYQYDNGKWYSIGGSIQ